MANNDNMHLVRLTNSIKKYMGETEAIEFAERHPLSKSANIEKN